MGFIVHRSNVNFDAMPDSILTSGMVRTNSYQFGGQTANSRMRMADEVQATGQRLAQIADERIYKRQLGIMQNSLNAARDEFMAFDEQYRQGHTGENGLDASKDYERFFQELDRKYGGRVQHTRLKEDYRLRLDGIREAGLDVGLRWQDAQSAAWQASTVDDTLERSLAMFKDPGVEPDVAMANWLDVYLPLHDRIYPGDMDQRKLHDEVRFDAARSEAFVSRNVAPFMESDPERALGAVNSRQGGLHLTDEVRARLNHEGTTRIKVREGQLRQMEEEYWQKRDTLMFEAVSGNKMDLLDQLAKGAVALQDEDEVRNITVLKNIYGKIRSGFSQAESLSFAERAERYAEAFDRLEVGPEEADMARLARTGMFQGLMNEEQAFLKDPFSYVENMASFRDVSSSETHEQRLERNITVQRMLMPDAPVKVMKESVAQSIRSTMFNPEIRPRQKMAMVGGILKDYGKYSQRAMIQAGFSGPMLVAAQVVKDGDSCIDEATLMLHVATMPPDQAVPNHRNAANPGLPKALQNNDHLDYMRAMQRNFYQWGNTSEHYASYIETAGKMAAMGAEDALRKIDDFYRFDINTDGDCNRILKMPRRMDMARITEGLELVSERLEDYMPDLAPEDIAGIRQKGIWINDDDGNLKFTVNQRVAFSLTPAQVLEVYETDVERRRKDSEALMYGEMMQRDKNAQPIDPSLEGEELLEELKRREIAGTGMPWSNPVTGD